MQGRKKQPAVAAVEEGKRLAALRGSRRCGALTQNRRCSPHRELLAASLHRSHQPCGGGPAPSLTDPSEAMPLLRGLSPPLIRLSSLSDLSSQLVSSLCPLRLKRCSQLWSGCLVGVQPLEVRVDVLLEQGCRILEKPRHEQKIGYSETVTSQQVLQKCWGWGLLEKRVGSPKRDAATRFVFYRSFACVLKKGRGRGVMGLALRAAGRGPLPDGSRIRFGREAGSLQACPRLPTPSLFPASFCFCLSASLPL